MLEQITEKIKTRVGEDCGLKAVLKFALDDDQYLVIDASVVPNIVHNEDQTADCTIKVKKVDMVAIMEGKQNAMTAFMFGKIKVEGNMGIAMNLSKIL